MKAPTVRKVIDQTAQYFGVPRETISTTSFRAPDVILNRHIAIYVASEVTYLSLRQIAKEFGMNYAGSTIHARNKVRELITNNKEVKDDVDAITKSVQEENDNANSNTKDTNGTGDK